VIVSIVSAFFFYKSIQTIVCEMVLSTKEKGDLVIDMLNKNCAFREISKIAHVSFTDICRIRKKITGEEIIVDDNKHKGKEQASNPISLSSQSFQLFKEGKSLVDVAIILDQPKDNVIQYYSDYLVLKNMKDVSIILLEYKNNLSTFLKLFNYLKKNNIRWVDIKHAIDNKIK
jgi:hypothetical protein